MEGTVLIHHGIKGQKWGIRRYQNPDGTLTEAGWQRYRTDKHFRKKVDANDAVTDMNAAGYAKAASRMHENGMTKAQNEMLKAHIKGKFDKEKQFTEQYMREKRLYEMSMKDFEQKYSHARKEVDDFISEYGKKPFGVNDGWSKKLYKSNGNKSVPAHTLRYLPDGRLDKKERKHQAVSQVFGLAGGLATLNKRTENAQTKFYEYEDYLNKKYGGKK